MRSILVDIIPSHVCLSQEDQVTLFGPGYAMTVDGDLSQAGQYVCEETVEVFGKLKRSLKLRNIGPHWEKSFVVLTKTEAEFLGIEALDAVVGDLSFAKPCKLKGPEGVLELESGVIVASPHLCCSPQDARELMLINGKKVSVEVLTQHPFIMDNVTVRIHPTYQLRLEINQDIARDRWITRSVHARVLDSPSEL